MASAARLPPRDSAETPVLAAGAVVRRVRDGETQLLLVHRPRYDDWSFAKGKLELGEHVLAAAVREVREESGYAVALRLPLPTQHYIADGRPKTVRYWLGEVVPGASDDLTAESFVANSEVDEIAWLPVEEARERLTWDRDRDLVDIAAAAPQTTPLIVVRHARALPRSAWASTAGDRDGHAEHSDHSRPLSETGQRQAERLVAALHAYAPTAVLTSDAERTVATVAPFAESAGLPLDSEPLFSESGFATSPDATRARAADLRALRQVTVVCSHRPVLRTLVAELLRGSGIAAPTEPLEVAGMWVLHLSEGRALAVERHDA